MCVCVGVRLCCSQSACINLNAALHRTASPPPTLFSLRQYTKITTKFYKNALLHYEQNTTNKFHFITTFATRFLFTRSQLPAFLALAVYICVTFSHCNLESVVDKYIVKKLNHVFHVKMFVVTFCFTQGNDYDPEARTVKNFSGLC